jgi:hypothetical protein
MNASTSHERNSVTFPHGFLDFLRISQGRRHRIGDYELEPSRLDRFNEALRSLSPEAPKMTMDQIASAAERALARHRADETPPFVQSRMAALERLEAMAEDEAWNASDELRRQVDVLHAYRDEDGDLIPDGQPVVGLLDDAVLVDIALQLLRGELADYEDFCRFRTVAADFAGLPADQTGLTRAHWLEAMVQARTSIGNVDAASQHHYVSDPRVSLFHIT